MLDLITALSVVFELGFFAVNHALSVLQLVPFVAFDARTIKFGVKLAVVDDGAAFISVPECS